MSKRRREADTDADTAELNPVFVDTNLGTHLAMLLCSSDTASDFRKKVAAEHKICFPEIGEIEVHSVMVKRRYNYYHLPDIMHVKSALLGVKSNWFLTVDASKISTCLSIRNSLERGASSDVKNAAAMTIKPLEKITDSHSSPCPEEHHVGTKSPAKKKRKVRHTEDACHNSSLEGGNAMFRPNGINEKLNMPYVKVSGERNDHYDVEGRLVSEGTSPPSIGEKNNLGSNLDSQNLTSTNRMEEGNTFESMVDHGLGKDVLPLGAVSITAPGSSAGMMDAGGGGGDVNTTGSKRKKKRVEKTAAKIQDTTDTEQIGKGESIKPSTDEMKKVEGFLLEDDDKVIMPSNSKSPGHVGLDLALKEASHFQNEEKSNFATVNSYTLKDSDEKKEDYVVESEMDYELDQGVPTVHSSGVCTNIADLSAAMVDTGGGSGDVNTDGKKRKKKKKAQKAAKVKDTRDVEQIGEDEVKKPQTETIRSEDKGASLKHDKVILPSESNYPDHVDPDLTQKEASVMRDSDAVMEPEISSCIKKKRERKRVGTNAENLGIKEIHKDIGGALDLPSPSGYHIPKVTGKDESIRLNEGMDVEMKLLDVSDHDAQEKVWELNRKEADLVQTQTEHTMENVSVGNKMMIEKTKSSTGDCHTDSRTAETDYTIMESNQADKDNENTKKKKKGKKSIGPRKEKLGVAKIHEGIVGSLDLPSPSRDHITMATGNDESIKLNEGTDVEMKLLDASDHDAQEKVWELNKKEADLVETQTEHTLKPKSSAGDCHADFPTAETEHSIMESNQADKDNRNTKKKKRRSKSFGTKKENLGITDISNGIRGSSDLPSPSRDHITMATGNDESIKLNEGTDVKMKLLDASDHDAQEKVWELNKREADLVETQTEHTLKSKSSAGDCHADFPTAETEHSIMESNQADKDNGNTKKKKKGRTSIGPRKEKLGVAKIHEGIVGSLDLPSPSRDHIPMATGNDESIKLNEGTDVEMKLLDASDHDAQEKVWELNKKEAGLVETQTEHTLKSKSSAGDCHADFPTAETEHSIMESNQADKDNGNTKKKKRRSKSFGTKKENLGITDISNGIRGSSDLPSPSDDHIPKTTGKDESTRINEGKNAQIKLLDASNHAAEENVLEVNRKEADLVESQTLENVTQSAAGNGHADFPTAEPENTIMESNQTNKSKYKKPTKKRRKEKHTATDVQENLPVKDQQVSIEPVATKEPSAFENSKLEGRYVDTSQVLSRRNEDKVDEMHELVPNTDGLAENFEKGSEGINSRQYLMADQLLNKADSSDMVRKTAKVRSSRIAKNNDVPSANIPTNLQNSVKSFENKKSENNSYREDTVRIKCVSVHNSDQDETSPNSVRRYSKTTEKKENGRSVLGQKVSGKPSSRKSSSERSVTLHSRRGNALLGRKISNMMKTPKKKISLAKPGGIFQDNSGESSGDDNGTMHSDDRTISPSDSSSMSGDSEGESELSQNSASNGSTGAKAKPLSMFDFSASTEVGMTIDHMKCSDLFKKSMKVAKPIEPIEFDPDGQPI